jgi:HPt (histidine-containing phosphotransfer) domain-containing protein
VAAPAVYTLSKPNFPISNQNTQKNWLTFWQESWQVCVPFASKTASKISGSASRSAAALAVTPAIDQRVLYQSIHTSWDDPAELVMQLMEFFVTHTLEALEALHQAVQNNDLSELHQALATLRSFSTRVGAFPLACLCQDLARRCRRTMPQDMPDWVAQLQVEHERVQDDLYQTWESFFENDLSKCYSYR